MNRAAPDRPTRARRRIAAFLYPFAAGAAAVNVFFLGLIGRAAGLSSLAPVPALLAGLVLGLPLAWIAARWVEGLIARAEEDGD